MRTASVTIQTAAFAALFAVYVLAPGSTGLSGVRRALQTIGTTVQTTTIDATIAAQAA
ncbi:MAG: hypothetical protein JJ913_13500 [Rhizobiaceae bacterium]|nr:hypothetical protein [Rhizobiaceae bacterium]